MSNENDTKSFFLGSLIGGIVGGVSALLLAPKSGERMRKDICSACKRIADEAKELASAVHDDITDAAEQGKEKAEFIFDETKEKFGRQEQSVKKEVKNHADV